MPPLPTTYLLPWDDDDDFSSLFVIRRLLFMAVDSKNPSHYITSHICANFQLQLNVNHAWVALNEIIEVQNALNQWLHFKIELNSRLFAFHIAFCRRFAISNFLTSQSPKTCSSFLYFMRVQFSGFLLTHILLSYNKLQLIYECNPSHGILRSLSWRDKCEILNANLPGGALGVCTLHIKRRR